MIGHFGPNGPFNLVGNINSFGPLGLFHVFGLIGRRSGFTLTGGSHDTLSGV